MHRIFIAGIISVSIAITALSANSAAASDRGTTNFLAGLAGLAILGAIIHDSNKKKKATTYSSRDNYVPKPKYKYVPQSRYKRGHIKRAPVRGHNQEHGHKQKHVHKQGHGHKQKHAAHSQHRGNVRHQPKARPLPHRVSRKLLPGNCLRSINTRHGQKRIFGGRCLNSNFRHVNKLPDACHTEFRANGQKRHGYGARCLRSNGYSIARN